MVILPAVRYFLRLSNKIAQGWPKSWAKRRLLIGIISQNAGPSRVIRAKSRNSGQPCGNHLSGYFGCRQAGLRSGSRCRRCLLPKARLGFGRIVASETEVPSMFANLA
jgi:hypothetical protein